MKKEINVNELNKIIAEHFCVGNVYVEKIIAGDQQKPQEIKIGGGNILTIFVDCKGFFKSRGD